MAALFLLCCGILPDSLLSQGKQFFENNTVHPVNGYGESSPFGLAHTTVPALYSQEDIVSYQVGHRAALFLRRKTGPNCSPPAPGRPRDAFRTQT
jgi:hypothetical protein